MSFFFRTNQIDFLNSVIVDLQRKNQDLKMKVEMMSEAALNGNGDDLNNYDRYFILSNADQNLRSTKMKVFKVTSSPVDWRNNCLGHKSISINLARE